MFNLITDKQTKTCNYLPQPKIPNTMEECKVYMYWVAYYVRHYSSELFDIEFKKYNIYYRRVYSRLNKDKINEKNKQYQLENKDKISERNKQKITCQCGVTISRSSLSGHKKSHSHIRFMDSL
tara:strand:- start:28 stop:396 length:369 start_codon:yes stop_codon:yes gene_type:complete